MLGNQPKKPHTNVKMYKFNLNLFKKTRDRPREKKQLCVFHFGYVIFEQSRVGLFSLIKNQLKQKHFCQSP